MKTSKILALGLGLCLGILPPAFGQAAAPAGPQDAGLCISQPGEVAQSGLYHFIISMITGDSVWVNPLPDGTAPGLYWRVEKDAQGRVVHAVKMHGRNETLSARFYYAGTATLPCRMEQYNQNRQLEETDIFHRDTAGNIVRSDEEDASGKATGYTITKYDKNQADDMEYAANGRLLQHYLYLYGTSGRMTGRTIYPGASASTTTFVVQEIDEDDGLPLQSQEYDAGKLIVTNKYVYADGELTHADSYGPDGHLDATRDWVNGLVMNKTYRPRNGNVVEFRYFFDNDGNPSTTDVYIDGRLLCTLKYTKMAPDQVATNVYGIDGKLWAYYPPPMVTQIERNGQPVGHTGGVIFKKGFWW